ncbi:MAG TPA: DUF4412 domain-containing protein [Nitrospira sp.]|nr:DUF4412 domain-containing protein [Nitrospira sp.]MCW5792726.1 DUF4412 domain-containing protein [Nitrospira sp.]HMU31521.1 DUF4412 domain-containing protein [Nitrospira sp.]HMW87381.1 DUF4412 domain-containing protein [Nitrospira sp.]HMX91450.1 DUF4412 domain-containing protein [Nitrospira sp.]
MRMKAAFLIGLVSSLTALPAYAGDFEGVIHMKNSHVDTGTSRAMDWYLKGDRGRVETIREDGQAHVMLFNGKTRTMQMGMPGQKSYMEISLEGDRGEHLNELLEAQHVERTGKTEKIAGYTCEVWRITDKEQHRPKSELCVAKGFGKAATFWIDPKEARRSSQPGWVKQLAEEGGFGLRSIQYDEAGKESGRMEVVSIEKKTLDASLFAFPADWAKHDLSGFQERMKAMREQKREGGADVSKMVEEMKKRKAARGKPGEAPGGEEQPPDMKELMKQFGEAMKKQQSQPQGGQ